MTPMTLGSCEKRDKLHTRCSPQPGPMPRASRVCPGPAGCRPLARLTWPFPAAAPPGASTKHILDDISTMFDALADQLDAMLD